MFLALVLIPAVSFGAETSLVEGCLPGNIFSSITGEPCGELTLEQKVAYLTTRVSTLETQISELQAILNIKPTTELQIVPSTTTSGCESTLYRHDGSPYCGSASA